ncbi:MAG: GntR family transcriptional regulator [Lentisphaeria bacterium]|nr:GntR family transcriptional regulator [Lentisphaeria bacterium]
MVSKNSEETLIRQLYQELYSRIKQGIYPDGSKLPGSNKLAREFEVSRSTVDSAIDLLVRKRYLERRSRSGTYVLDRKLRILYIWHHAQKEFDPGDFNEDMAINQLLLHGLYVESPAFGMEITSEYILRQITGTETDEQFFRRTAETFDGAVIRGFDPNVEKLLVKHQIPYAKWSGRCERARGGCTITDDRRQAFRGIISRLKEKDYRKIFIITAGHADPSCSTHKNLEEKTAEFARMAAEEGLTETVRKHIAAEADWELFKTLTPQDAVFCTHTNMVSKIYIFCQKNGMTVGKNFGLFGYASGMTFAHLYPETSYGQIDFRSICRQLCCSLQNMILAGEYADVQIPSTFVEGASL